MEPILFASGRDDWETPPELMAVLRREFLFGDEFGLDPCSTFDTRKGTFWFGPDNSQAPDGLAEEWAGVGDTAFVNPPFGVRGAALPLWTEKCYREVACGRMRLVVALLPARTDTAWWHDYIWPYATEIRFLRGRVRFGLDGKVGAECATFPSAVVVYEKGKLGWGRSGPWDWRKGVDPD